MSLRVLVADDSIVFRRIIADVLASQPDVEVVASVATGRLALQRVRELSPDLVTLDIEMPEMDGLAVLDGLRQAGPMPAVIVVSSVTQRGGAMTIRALEKGAFDFIAKPDCSSPEASREAIRRELAPRVRALANRVEVRNILRSTSTPGAARLAQPPIHAPALGNRPGLSEPLDRTSLSTPLRRPEVIVIGVSTGGPVALSRLLPSIPANIGVPLLIVQHMPPVFTQSLAENLSSKCSIRVCEAAHGDVLQPGTAYIAPGGRQMRLAADPTGSKVIQITDDPPENNCRPAVDYLFRSVANHFPGRAVAAILTGMGGDGTIGLRLLKRHGCYVVAQDEPSCVVFGMPRAAIQAGVTDVTLPLDAIAARLVAIVRTGKP